MTEGITILGLADRARWVEAHEQGGLPSQSWDYAYGLSASGIEPKLAIVDCAGARMLLPFHERVWRGAVDIATLPGLSGASIAPPAAAPLALWTDYARARGWVSGYIQLAPQPAGFVDSDIAIHDSCLAAHQAVFIFDLRRGDLLADASRTIRRKIRHGLGDGASLVEDREILLDSLLRLYAPSMERLGAAPAFSSQTLSRWALAPSTLMLGVMQDQAIKAVHLGHVAGEWAEWQVAATSEDGRGLAILIYWRASQILRDRGVRYFNMGGGGRLGDGVFDFKLRMGGAPTPLRSLRQVYDRPAYEALRHDAGVSTETAWFPAYRASARG